MQKKYSSMLVVLVLVLLLISLSCGSDSENMDIDSEESSYIAMMNGYYNEWEELDWCRITDANCSDGFDEIVNALLDINPPFTKAPEHSDYVNAHQLYAHAVLHLDTMTRREEERARAQGYDIWSDLYRIDCHTEYWSYRRSREYSEACYNERLARTNLVLARSHWWYEYILPLELELEED